MERPQLNPQDRIDFAHDMVQASHVTRSVTHQEDRRLGYLMHEMGIEPEVAAAQQDIIKENLDASREAIRQGVIMGVDDIAVDAYLGLRQDESVLPPMLRRIHKDAEEREGRDLSFLGWMADHATDEQLLNVWQWHDHYLETQDSSPEFQESVTKFKENYSRGLQGAVASGTLDEAMLATPE